MSLDLRARMASYSHWYHQIELAPGLVTPGGHDSAKALALLDDLGLPREASGLKVLDLGCRDGFFSFEMERRGAAVTALDYVPPEETGFALAAEILGSRVRPLTANVYDLFPDRLGHFDVVLCLGLLYHLRHPMLALDRIFEVCRPEALLFVESAVAVDPTVTGASLPLWQFCPGDSCGGDATMCWLPSPAGLAALIEECQFRVRRAEVRGPRALLAAVAARDERQAFFRDLDTSTGAPARPNAFWREKTVQ